MHCSFSTHSWTRFIGLRHCRFVTVLQTYQAMSLVVLGLLVPADSPLALLLNKVIIATD